MPVPFQCGVGVQGIMGYAEGWKLIHSTGKVSTGEKAYANFMLELRARRAYKGDESQPVL